MPAAMRRLLVLLPVLVLAGCGGGSKETAATTAPRAGGCLVVDAPGPKPDGGQKPPATALDPARTYSIVFRTNCGTFVVALDQKSAPHATASLVALARKGFFDGTIFHRVVPGFVIQGGDPTQTGGGGPGYQTVDRPPADARYVKGVVAMAKTAAEPPGTAGSQFFVVTGADAGLPPQYALVGRVVKGLGVVERIGKLGDASEQPTLAVEIERARVTTS
jgi:peptidyl-prolyl cis-trans isomerase B (cyclophilin B)